MSDIFRARFPRLFSPPALSRIRGLHRQRRLRTELSTSGRESGPSPVRREPARDHARQRPRNPIVVPVQAMRRGTVNHAEENSMATALAQVTLDDKYTLTSGRIYLTGIQALVRLPIMQRQRDFAAGLNTAGFVSGYRGSPLGALDQTLWKARSLPRAQPHSFPTRHQRGPRRHQRVGHPAGQHVPGRPLRRCVRHVVRQGAGRRSQRRRVQARQRSGHITLRRRAGRRRRTTIPASHRRCPIKANTPSWMR